MCIDAGADFALSSDAHAPDQVGFGYDDAMEFLASLGVEEICVFNRRRRRLEPLGRAENGGDGADPAREKG
jgi:histidinol-phosphatase (PHP family)